MDIEDKRIEVRVTVRVKARTTKRCPMSWHAIPVKRFEPADLGQAEPENKDQLKLFPEA